MSQKPPSDLSAEAAQLWRDLTADFEINDSAGLRLLRVACEALDEQRRCEERIAEDGMVTKDGRRHPLLGCVRDSRQAMLTALRLLRLEPSAPEAGAKIGRPPQRPAGARGGGL